MTLSEVVRARMANINYLTMTLREVVRARMAMISLATVMSNWVSLVNPFSVPDWPIVIFLRNLNNLLFIQKRKCELAIVP